MIFIYFRTVVSQSTVSLHRWQVLFSEDTSGMEFPLTEEEIKCGLKVIEGLWEGPVRAGWLKPMMLSDDSAALPPPPPKKLPVSNYLACSEVRERKSIHLQSQVEFGWGSSALMQEDVALTEAACPLSKSNYDNHASGKAVARRTARQALIRQAAYLNHCSPPLQTPSSPNVEGLAKKGGPGPLRAPLSRCVAASPPWNIICFSCPSSHQKWVMALLF